MTQKLTITFEHEYGSESVSLTRDDLVGDDIFWNWFENSWDTLGLSFVKKGLTS